ncbi:MATE family efflux transporter [Pseudolysobacter antarcticus]|uniref:MATE family efflux transporter n=1 Tax=Pseudolysobacter antarcticus TaxID=2511995 RepID=A0A411HJS0_9GAMM|nr:MATE family efflux transporter [Pseudolysobacter antarcticus]QBB70786.1 MATE family efflux transporter [Pseudolysobacter antarcticus]
MKDLTQGSITRHILEMAAPMAAGMIIRTLYYLVDLYFVARLGDAALAGVSAAGNVMFIVLGLTQVLGVGTMALISHAVGRKDHSDANLIFNQSLVLSIVCSLLMLLGGYGLASAYMHSIAADADTAAAGITYLKFYLPGLALQFSIVAMSSALRGTGIVTPTMIVSMVTLLLNIILAPILIAGWGTGHAFGVAGAGLASTLAVAVGVVMLAVYFMRLEKYVSFDRALWRPRFATWKRMLGIGLPAGCEFGLMFVSMAVIYWIIRDFGASAQAGFGIGSRVMKAVFLPVVAVAFSVAPIAGQNFGANKPARVRETFRSAALIGSALMLLLTLMCQWRPQWFVSGFSTDPKVIEVGAQFLHIISWNFVASGIFFTCSGMFQALGNTWPAFISTATRLVTFAIPAIWLSRQPSFQIVYVWYLSVATGTLQTIISVILVQQQLRRRMPMPATVADLA